MNDANTITTRRDDTQRERSRSSKYCAVCSNRIWLSPAFIQEPENAPEPRLSWVLCKECHGAFIDEYRRSPVRGPLRARIAMGMIAADRWAEAYPTETRAAAHDHKWVVFIAAGTFIAMILHLVLIVVVAGFPH